MAAWDALCAFVFEEKAGFGSWHHEHPDGIDSGEDIDSDCAIHLSEGGQEIFVKGDVTNDTKPKRMLLAQRSPVPKWDSFMDPLPTSLVYTGFSYYSITYAGFTLGCRNRESVSRH